jgi:hypothetical protein
MAAKKTIAGIAAALVLVAAGMAAYRHYLDHIRPPEISPRQVIEKYFAAVNSKEYEAAYAFVSSRHYHESFNQFVDRVNLYSPAMRLEVTGERLEEDGTAVVEARIVVPMAFGPFTADTRMDLARMRREWKIIHP